jgi:hypothetical protein
MQSGVIRRGVVLTAVALGLVTSIGAPAFAQTRAPSGTAAQSPGSGEAQQPRYRFIVNHNSAKCLDVRGASVMDGAAVIQATCERNRQSQQWRPEPKHGKFIQLRNRESNLCLDVRNASAANGAGLIQSTCGESHSQHWRRDSVENRYEELMNENSGKCINVRRESKAEDARAVQAACVRERRSQHWELRTTLPRP